MGWTPPDVHIRALVWLATIDEHAVLLCFRGFGKSTLLAIVNAWRLWRNRDYRILHQGADDGTSYKTSRDTLNVLRLHPWCDGLLPRNAGVENWWVEDAVDPRNASFYARGILSNVTSSRADECQNDDVEVPRNIATDEAREKLRYRLGEQVHILVPGGRRLFIGTPHTHDTIYEEQRRLGADVLTIPLFENAARFEQLQSTRVPLDWKPEFVFDGIGEYARSLRLGRDYEIERGGLRLAKMPTGALDVYGPSVWPERFDRSEVERRRQQTNTLNEWDSQYLLRARPVSETRLDPERLMVYDAQPQQRWINGQLTLWLGQVQLVGVSAYWDCSLGKVHSDKSVLSVVYTDAEGRLYWHVAEALRGDVDAQCARIREIVEQLLVSRVTVETNGPGGFVPPILRKHLAGLTCAVGEEHATENKQRRILDALEPPLSAKFLWAHLDVANGPLWDQMQAFNPAARNQADDYLDSGAGAIRQTPVRIGRTTTVTRQPRNDWQPASGQFQLERPY